MPDVRTDLVTEAKRLHHTLFRSEISEETLKRFLAAELQILNSLSPQARLTHDRLLEIVKDPTVDLEALEYALRKRDRYNVLTQKMLALTYVCEIEERYYDTFHNDRFRPVVAFFTLGCGVVSAIVKRIRGEQILKRYALV